MNDDSFSFLPSSIVTTKAADQPIHVDFTTLYEDEFDAPWVLHAPLCEEGAWLNVVTRYKSLDENEPTEITPLRIFIPFGLFLVMKGAVMHSGTYGSNGNMRFHMVMGKSHEIESDSLRYLDKSTHERLPSASDCSKNKLDIADADPAFVTKVRDYLIECGEEAYIKNAKIW